jgi:NAD(P)-dependent dehydrogenase (short-subunit alcohol dehydrogenase family)
MARTDYPQTVVVTGAARRLGNRIAAAFARPGTRIAVHYRSSVADAEDAVAAFREAGAEAASFQADLSDQAAVSGFAAKVAERYGEVDLLVASAAVFKPTPWPEISDEDWSFHMETNLGGTFRLARSFAPHMRDGGLIVTFGDWSAQRPYRDFLPYCVSKAGVLALTRALALEMAPAVRVNCICPGTMLPPETASEAKRSAIAAATPLQRLGTPEDVVNAVEYLWQADFMTGSELVVDGGRLIANSDWSPQA